MRVELNGSRVWFDVDGAGLVPDGRSMRRRPTVVLLHGGPGSYDHSYLKPYFGALTTCAQVVYVESITRMTSPSVSCRLLAPFADRIYVQWESLSPAVPRSQYAGTIL